MGVLQRSSWGKHWESTCKSSCKSTCKSICKSSYKMLRHRRLGFLLASLLLISLGSPAHGQGGFGNFIQNLFRPIMRPLNNLLRPINFGLRDIFRFGPQTNAAFRAAGRARCALGTQHSAGKEQTLLEFNSLAATTTTS